MPFFDDKSGSPRNKLDDSLTFFMADHPTVAAQALILGMLLVEQGYYFQVGTNKALTSFMFSYKKEGNNVSFYCATQEEFLAEFTEVLDHFVQKFPQMATKMRLLTAALKMASEEP